MSTTFNSTGFLCIACGLIIEYNMHGRVCTRCNTEFREVELPLHYFTDGNRCKYLTKEEIVEILI